MKRIQLPLDELAVRALRQGDEVLLSGRVVTARDVAHKHLSSKEDAEARAVLEGGVIYHCGPVVKRLENGEWKVTAAGPTTSSREEPYQAKLIEQYKVRAVIGKGGMGLRTLAACQRFGAVYLHAIGGLAAILAQRVVNVEGVQHLEDFGPPEAMWILQVQDFPAIVTMDSHGQSLHRDVEAQSRARLSALLGGT
jgi:fumarate hydratase class I